VQEKHLYEYAVIRVMPRVDREEFINVGVILYCAPKNFLRADCVVHSEKLRIFAGDADLSELDEHLESLCRICKGGKDAGPIGSLSIGERFRWLTAPRSTIVQTSAVHTGFTGEPENKLADLMDKLVK
jgi:hypothetical protein